MAPVSPLFSPTAARQTALGEEVYRGLRAHPKTLSPWLFYDRQGSQLFEQITELPEYYVTRTERAIFAAHADAILAMASGADSAGSPEENAAASSGAAHPPAGRAAAEEPRRLAVIELGAGTASKTGLLLAAAVRRQAQLDYYAIDVSESALAEAKEHLEEELPGVRVHTRVADYTEGLDQIDDLIGAQIGAQGGLGQVRRLVLYIGSSIGNFEPKNAAALLADVHRTLAPGDRLLLGADLVKDRRLLEAAYDDAAGVTAAFNKNVLTRINRELGANFRLPTFSHSARWNAERSRMEMHLESTLAQTVSLSALELEVSFAPGETIHTENSYKFTDEHLVGLLEGAGFSLLRAWKDAQQWFGVYLAEAR